MPHVVVKMFTGRDAETKAKIAKAVTDAIVTSAKSSESAISVDIVDVDPQKWDDEVYAKEILPKMETLAKKPGYNPFEK